MLVFTSLLLLGAAGIWIFLQQPPFGSLPGGARLERIQASPNFRDGQFQNQHPTPDLAEGVTYWSVIQEFFFTKKERMAPETDLPSEKTDLKSLSPTDQVLVWFGHSSYFIQVDGKKILVDPVFSGHASPLSFNIRAFKGSDRYTVADLPAIDYLFITHDHWDHLDYKTLLELKGKVGAIFTGLGTGAHLERWGFPAEKITEFDWYEGATPDTGFQVVSTPARHFSGRGLKRNQSLWSSFVLKTPSFSLYLGGDSGYDTHFAEIGRQFGPFDLALLENGQYNASWKYIHMMPDEVLQAARDLGARRLMPVHSAKFALALHAWDTPLRTLTELNAAKNLPLVTPKIGQAVWLADTAQVFEPWWEGVK